MNWQEYAIEELQKYYSLKRAFKNNNEMIKAIETSLYNTSGINYETDRVQGGDQFAYENSLIERIYERDKFKQLNEFNAVMIKSIESGLRGLSVNERLILDIYYMDRPSDHIQVAMDRLNCKRTTVFEKKDQALKKYMRNKFGAFDVFNHAQKYNLK